MVTTSLQAGDEQWLKPLSCLHGNDLITVGDTNSDTHESGSHGSSACMLEKTILSRAPAIPSAAVPHGINPPLVWYFLTGLPGITRMYTVRFLLFVVMASLKGLPSRLP